jgi:membrane protease subunit (stomatin/prohibitin family)
MMRRRRPLLRAAAIGGAGVAVGHSMANKSAHEAQQDAQLAQMQPQAEPAPAAEAPPAATPADPLERETAKMSALARLKEMVDQGVLTQPEFDKEKAKILQGP